MGTSTYGYITTPRVLGDTTIGAWDQPFGSDPQTLAGSAFEPGLCSMPWDLNQVVSLWSISPMNPIQTIGKP